MVPAAVDTYAELIVSRFRDAPSRRVASRRVVRKSIELENKSRDSSNGMLVVVILRQLQNNAKRSAVPNPRRCFQLVPGVLRQVVYISYVTICDWRARLPSRRVALRRLAANSAM